MWEGLGIELQVDSESFTGLRNAGPCLVAVQYGSAIGLMTHDSNEVGLQYELLADMSIIFLITCPSCSAQHRLRATELGSGVEIHCSCGAVLAIEGDDFVQIQEAIRSLDP